MNGTEGETNSYVVGATLTFVWIIELEDVGPGWVVWQHHHPSSHTHLLTGAGLILRLHNMIGTGEKVNTLTVLFIFIYSGHVHVCVPIVCVCGIHSILLFVKHQQLLHK